LIEKDSNILLDKMCNDLNIQYDRSDTQDWGIINADAKRVEEFINYYVKNKLHRTQQYSLFELIIASYNETLLQKIDTETLNKIFLEFINNYKNETLNGVIEYWKSIYDEDNFPVGKLL
jgi:hypothetical protein